MEKHLLKLIKLADELNEKQDKVFAEIHYCGDDSKKLEICIRMKKEYKYVEFNIVSNAICPICNSLFFIHYYTHLHLHSFQISVLHFPNL